MFLLQKCHKAYGIGYMKTAQTPAAENE